MLDRATAAADASLPALEGDDDASMRQLDAAWCAGRGAAVAAQARAAQRAGDAFRQELEPQEVRLIEQVNAALMRRTQQQLQARGDARSLALVHWLDAISNELSSSVRRQAADRLLAAARAESDPLLLVVAQKWACRDAACRQELATRWAALEPDNLQALLSEGPGTNADAWLARLSAARRSDSYRVDLMAQLLATPPPVRDGLVELSRSVSLQGLSAAWSSPGVNELIASCSNGSAQRAQRCAAVADRLWTLESDDHMLPQTALRLIARQASQRAAWETRAQQMEAVLARWEQDVNASTSRFARQLGCVPSDDDRQAQNAQLLDGEWARLQAQLDRSGEDVAQLSRQHRQRFGGRGLLDPLPD